MTPSLIPEPSELQRAETDAAIAQAELLKVQAETAAAETEARSAARIDVIPLEVAAEAGVLDETESEGEEEWLTQERFAALEAEQKGQRSLLEAMKSGLESLTRIQESRQSNPEPSIVVVPAAAAIPEVPIVNPESAVGAALPEVEANSEPQSKRKKIRRI